MTNKIKRTVITWLLVMVFMFTGIARDGLTTKAAAGIAGNGTQGIYIDINAAPYTTMAQVPTWGKYAYGVSGCAWFATSRAKQLTGKNISNIYAGPNWYNNMYRSFGFSRGKDIPTTQKALACYNGHISVVEKVVGNTVYISEGGNQSYGGNSYCCIRGVSKAYLTGANINGGFIGFVYLGVDQGAAQAVQQNVTFQNQKVNFANAANAELYTKIMNPGRQRFSKVGCYLYNENGTLVKSYSESCTLATSYVNYTCNVQGDMKYILSSGTTYKYVLYAVVGGKEYKDAIRTFKTSGSRISFTGQKANFIQSNNAELYVKILNPDRKRFSSVGCDLYNSDGKLIKSYSEKCTLATSYVNYNCNFKTDMNYTLTSKTTYRYVLYAVVDGVTYKDSVRQFTTR